MNILVLGGGGREHTFCWKLSQSRLVKMIFVAPGNAGTAQIAKNLDFKANDFSAIRQAVIKNEINIVLVGPEDPLVNGIHDFFLSDATLKSIPVIGPTKKAAKLEGSKEFAKKFMKRNSIPTAKYAAFSEKDITKGHQFLNTLNPPYVLKADGLAAGKGVLIIDTLEEAKKELSNMLEGKKFGQASEKVVIEEFLSGVELSCFLITDGTSYLALPMAKDYKRIGEGDTGLNTGGMGAISPVPFVSESFSKKIHEQIIEPTINGLKKEEIEYVGFLFIGLIKVGQSPYVIEYNVRMGDPETEVVIPRIKNDFAEILLTVVNQEISKVDLKIDPRAAATIFAVSGGYPETYEKGKKILGLDKINESEIFHAGTILKHGEILTNGGRVLTVTSLGEDVKKALKKAYAEMDKINFDNLHYRKDIGFDL